MTEIKIAAFRDYTSPFETPDRLLNPRYELRAWARWRREYAESGDPEWREHGLQMMLSEVTAENPPARHRHRTPGWAKVLRWSYAACLVTGLGLIPLGVACVPFLVFLLPLSVIILVTASACGYPGCAWRNN
jgi:hypothetical protein